MEFSLKIKELFFSLDAVTVRAKVYRVISTLEELFTFSFLIKYFFLEF